MMIVFDDGFLTEFYNCRMVAIAGSLGDGKTLLALEIAEKLLQEGYKLVSNMSCVWNEDITKIAKHDKCVVIVDEGGTYLRSGEAVNNFSRFLRKIDYYLIMPCRKLPHEELCELKIYPWFNFYKHFGIPLKVWNYEVSKYDKNYNGKVFQWGWAGTYGVYSTLDPGDYPELLMQFVYNRTQALFEEYDRRLKLSDVALKSKSARESEQIEMARDIQAGADKIKRSVSLYQRESSKNRGRKRGII